MGVAVSYLSVDEGGWPDPEELATCLRPETLLVSTMHVNNETHQCLNTLWNILLTQKDESDSWKQYLSPYCLEKVERYFNAS